MELILASASPRRRELLEKITKTFTVCAVDADETIDPDAPLSAEVERLSLVKAQAAHDKSPEAVCIGADTMVTIDGLRLGKPRDAVQAKEMLTRLSGRAHEVLTGLAVLLPDGTSRVLHTVTRVVFRALQECEIDAYLATGEPFDKAGSYGIQGRGAILVDHIEGDYYSVMGLPVARLYEVLRAFDIV